MTSVVFEVVAAPPDRIAMVAAALLEQTDALRLLGCPRSLVPGGYPAIERAA